jgi:phosphoserine phosphatase
MLTDATPPYGTIAFDCDSTLAAIEGIDELAPLVGASEDVRAEIAALTERAMAGEIPLQEVYAKRLELLRPDAGVLERLGALYVEHRLQHAEHLVAALNSLEKRVCIVSGGLKQPVLALAAVLGVVEDNVYAVEAFLDREGAYVGFDELSPCARAGGKLDVLRELAREEHAGGVVLIGDGATDLEAAPAARRFIAFAGVLRRPAVVAASTVVCDSADLATLLPLLVSEDELDRLEALGGHEALLQTVQR